MLKWSLFRQGFSFFIACIAFGLVPGAIKPADSELEVKVAFIIKFIDFIEWPVSTPPLQSFTIGYIGDGEMLEALKSLPSSTKPQGKELRILQIEKHEDIKQSRPKILVIDSTNPRFVQTALRQTEKHPIVSITHGEGFAEMGSLINFFIEDSRLRFEVNLRAAEQRNIKIRSQLLRLGRVITE